MSVNPENLSIVHYPHPVLRAKAKPVERVDETVRAVAERMIELMHEARGVGLAAPQVGLDWRMFVVNATGEPGDDRVYINPVLSNPSKEMDLREEGCLSLPGIHADINRPVAITIAAHDEHNTAFEQTADDLLARVWQHEYDHLDGVLITDKMSPVDRMANRRTLKDLEKGG